MDPKGYFTYYKFQKQFNLYIMHAKRLIMTQN